MLILKRHRLCIIAGIFSSAGSMFCKLPTLASNDLHLSFKGYHFLAGYMVFYVIPWVLMILCNFCSWRCVLKANQLWEQTLPVTVLTTASNYITSFLVSSIIFNENWTFISWLGVTSLIIGVNFLCQDTQYRHTTRLKST